MLETKHLILRQWKNSDHLPFINMGQDQDVMKFFPKYLTMEESLTLIQTLSDIINHKQWGIWAVELKQNRQFIGFIGLHDQPTQFDFSPCIEIAWRLAKEYWGKGYATEGAKAVLEHAFYVLKFNKIVSFTSTINHPSEAVMKKLGMKKITMFKHPEFSNTSSLEQHVLYEITRSDFIQTECHSSHL